MNTNNKKELKGKRYKCLRVVKGLSIEDIPTMREQLASQIKGIDGVSMMETPDGFEISNGQFLLKPKCNKETIGVLDCTRTFATFDGVRIEYSEMKNVFASCFETGFAQYAIHATI